MAFNFPDSPVEGQEFLAPAGPVYKYTDGKWALMGGSAAPAPLLGFRNLLMNPYGAIGQRIDIVGGTVVADDTYAHDRWYVLSQTASIFMASAVNAEAGMPYALQLLQHQAAAQRMGYAQIIEGRNCKHLRGKAVTLSGRIKSTDARTIRYAILEWVGTEDVVTSDVVLTWTSTTYTNSNFFIADANLIVRAVGSVALAAGVVSDITPLTAALGPTLNNLIVFLWTEATVPQNANFFFAPQLEEGSVATPREFRPYPVELAMCQRYYEVAVAAGAAGMGFSGNVTSANVYYGWTRFSVAKRAAPTIVGTTVGQNAFPATPGTMQVSPDAFLEGRAANATGVAFFLTSWTASAEL